MPNSEYLSSVEEIIEDARNGRMFILVDDEDRENEGDLVIPAQMATPDAVNFMATNGRGLICLSLTGERVEELGLSLMSPENDTRLQTAFTLSIEAREGVTTGISASDRARTIACAIDSSKGKDDIHSPGHVFPLIAREGGVLVRTGHTEAAVDVSRLAGLYPAGVICEIMKDDGTMARLPDLITFAQHHGLKIATIADLIAFRLENDRIVNAGVETSLTNVDAGDFRTIVYNNVASKAEHLALVRGDVSTPGPVLVRMHSFNMFEDIFSVRRSMSLHRSMQIIAKEGRGAIVMIRSPSPESVSVRIKAHREKPSPSAPLLREYGVGAQILLDLGIKEMILLSNSDREIIGLKGYGLSIAERRGIDLENFHYKLEGEE